MKLVSEVDSEAVKAFIRARLAEHRTEITAVSVDKYPSEFSATVWMAGEPGEEIRRLAYELEAELSNLGISCSIIVKTDRELPFEGRYKLGTRKGEFVFRYYRGDATKDEDMVYMFVLYQGPLTYRFRISLSGTLASMLRSRNRLNEERVLEVYLDRIRRTIEERPDLEETQEIMFSSRDLTAFVAQ